MMPAEAIPPAGDARGVSRVARTPVTLDLVVRAFNCGATAEENGQEFPSLQLRMPASFSATTLGTPPSSLDTPSGPPVKSKSCSCRMRRSGRRRAFGSELAGFPALDTVRAARVPGQGDLSVAGSPSTKGWT